MVVLEKVDLVLNKVMFVSAVSSSMSVTGSGCCAVACCVYACASCVVVSIIAGAGVCSAVIAVCCSVAVLWYGAVRLLVVALDGPKCWCMFCTLRWLYVGE